MLLLELYDNLTEERMLQDSLRIEQIARKYYENYRKNCGMYGWDTSIRIDFMIVACASFHGLDIVYSADNKTLHSKPAMKSYNEINLSEDLRTPNLLTYEDLL